MTQLATTDAGLVLGTAGYMSPEQVRGERADARSDIFSFGCVLCEMLACRRAFAGGSQIEAFHAVLKEHPPDLTTVRGDLPQSLNRVVRRCLEKAPDGRFQTARDLVFALENLAAGSDPTPVPAPSAPTARARRAAVAAGVAILAISASLLGWYVLRDARAHAPARQTAPIQNGRLLAVLPFENISAVARGISRRE